MARLAENKFQKKEIVRLLNCSFFFHFDLTILYVNDRTF